MKKYYSNDTFTYYLFILMEIVANMYSTLCMEVLQAFYNFSTPKI